MSKQKTKDGIIYKIDNSEASIVDIVDKDSFEVILSPKIDGYPVTRISSYAFEGCTSLEKVKLPNTLKFIGPKAFFNCIYLKSITIPDSVEAIGEKAFDDRSVKRKIVISENSKIDDKALPLNVEIVIEDKGEEYMKTDTEDKKQNPLIDSTNNDKGPKR